MSKNCEECVEVTKDATPRRVSPFPRSIVGCKGFRTRAAVIPTFVLVLVGLVTFDLVMETKVEWHTPELAVLNEVSEVIEEGVCSPKVVDVSNVTYHSGHRYYYSLEQTETPAPRFRGDTTALCDEEKRNTMKYNYCLPISGRKDTPFCTAGDRSDLLGVRSPNSVCFASVLHMLLVEVYEELQATGNTPLIVFGSLLGAVRNGSMIPFTEDTDIGFVDKLHGTQALREELWRKGYHMFFMKIWRVCVAPTHPLAGRLYNPNIGLARSFAVPYVDLYQMKKVDEKNWDIQELQGRNGRLMATDKVEPFSQVTINGMPFGTVHEPKFFLTEAYGPNYMTPRRRRPAPAPKPQVVKAANNVTKST
ncbi:unnamed protein product [Phytophthora lilii]|uniref:Unnamed protein product n=1 Tax=Phytophthora lilii TaxID=2077276 RepID=A0A9W6TBP7_9STRA|nr:unnamed protein product [Phytophthora lilii]